MASKDCVSVAAPPAPSGLFVKAMDILFKQEKSFLTPQELGLSSACSKDVQKLVRQNAVWKKVFEHAVESCKEYESDERASTELEELFPKAGGNDHQKSLPECFQNPDPRILAKAGYETATRCLLSQYCFYCGYMAGTANPLTLRRTCMQCAMEADEECLMMSDETAKKELLLEDHELSLLASFELHGKRMFSLSDVKSKSSEKWSGHSGHTTELLRKAKGVGEQEQDVAQYFEDLDYLEMTEPMVVCIGSVHDSDILLSKTPKLKMSCSYFCPECEVGGNLMAIARHARLAHGIIASCTRAIPETTAPPGLTLLSALGLPEELVCVMEQADIVYNQSSTTMIMGTPLDDTEYLRELIGDLPFEDPGFVQSLRQNPDFSDVLSEDHYNACTILLPKAFCTIAVDCNRTPPVAGTQGWGSFTVWYQAGLCKVPFQLLHIGIGENCSDDCEATARAFAPLFFELGLQSTTPSQLLAAVITRAMPVDEFLDKVLDNDEDFFGKPWLDANDIPIFRHACKILKDSGYSQTKKDRKKIRPQAGPVQASSFLTELAEGDSGLDGGRQAKRYKA